MAVCLFIVMLSAIELDDEMGFVADEIDDVDADRFLTLELPRRSSGVIAWRNDFARFSVMGR